MHPITRALAVAYIVLAAVGSVVLVQTSINYVLVTEIRVNIHDRVAVTAVEILWNRSANDDPIVKVFVNATNPGRIPLEVTNVDFNLHMDDPYDAFAWDDATGLARTAVRSGGYTPSTGQSIVIPPGETRTIEAIVPIQGPVQSDLFDRPDASGKYHPIVWNTLFVYAYQGFELRDSLRLQQFYEKDGVAARG